MFELTVGRSWLPAASSTLAYTRRASPKSHSLSTPRVLTSTCERARCARERRARAGRRGLSFFKRAHVLGLEISMHHVHAVQRRERLEEVLDQQLDLALGEGLVLGAADEERELVRRELHHEEPLPERRVVRDVVPDAATRSRPREHRFGRLLRRSNAGAVPLKDVARLGASPLGRRTP